MGTLIIPAIALIFVENMRTQVAMHRGDSEMVERGDLDRPALAQFLSKLISWIIGIGDVENFRPDIYLEEGDSLSKYGLEAKVLHLPGHSNGSIGILTAGGDLFCGDLFVNAGKPRKHFIVTDSPAFNSSIQRLKSLTINTVYPGHGQPFLMERL